MVNGINASCSAAQLLQSTCGVLRTSSAAQLDATLQRKKGSETYLIRSADPPPKLETVNVNYSMAPPPVAVDQTVAVPPVADGNPYSTPVWQTSNKTS
eukprot:g32288.t2